MKKFTATTFIIAVFTTLTFSQTLTQTVRGTILDVDSKLPLIGATVVIVGSNPTVGTSTDVNGIFKFENITIGRIALQTSYIGYKDKIIPEIIINSGKESVLEITMQESVVKLDEVVVKACSIGTVFQSTRPRGARPSKPITL